MKKRIFFVLVLTVTVSLSGWSQQRELKRYTTHQTSLTNNDIMNSFVDEVRSYLQRYDSYGNYYFVGYEVYQDKDKQNYAWTTSTTENKHQWGTVYTIRLWISNAVLRVMFCNTSFSSDGQDAQAIVTTRFDTNGGAAIRYNIVATATSMFGESAMVLKMYNDRYSKQSIDAIGDLRRIMY